MNAIFYYNFCKFDKIKNWNTSFTNLINDDTIIFIIKIFLIIKKNKSLIKFGKYNKYLNIL